MRGVCVGSLFLAMALLGCEAETWNFRDGDAAALVEASYESDALTAAAAPGDAGADAGADAGDGPAGPCPSTGGTAMVRVPTAQGGFCIDVTETTGAQYAQFLQGIDGGPGRLPPECARAPSHRPAAGVQADQTPVANVNWCDAYAYCAWAGKRLCGQIGGTGNVSAWNSATDDEWYAACSRGGSRAFPYGATVQFHTCNGYAQGLFHTVPVASMPACVGGYDGIFDMSGNVWEWEASCTTSSDGLIDPCRARGGGWYSDQSNLSCLGDSAAQPNFDGGLLVRSSAYAFLGIRCCAD